MKGATSPAPSVVRSVSVGGAASSSGCGVVEGDAVRWFLSLTPAERSYALALEDKSTVKLALSLYHQRAVKGDGYFFDLNADSPPPRRSSASLSPTNANAANATASNALHALQTVGRAKDDSTAKVLRRGRGRSNSSSTPLSASLSPSAFTSSASASSLHSLPLSPQAAPVSPSYGFRGADKLHSMFHSSAAKQAAEQRLESALRLCDTRQYCDTMLLSAELCGEREGKEVLELLSTLSAGRFLSQPCTAVEPAVPTPGKSKRGSSGCSSGSGGSSSSSTGGSTALSESPAWFRSLGFFSFAVWVASRMEVALWLRYREAKASERGERRSSAALTNLVRERLSSKAPLQQFWQSLSVDRRDKVWQKLTAMVEAVRRRDDTDDSKSNASSTSFSTTHEQDLADWADEEKLQLSPSVVVSPLSGSSSMSLSMSRSDSTHRSDINSAPIAAARSRGRSVSPPPSRRKPSLPTSASASHPPSTLSFPISPPFRAQPRQISIPSSTASASSATSSPARSLSPSSSSSSLPSRAHTPPPHPQRNRSSSALSASSTLSCPSAHSKRSSADRRKDRRKSDKQRPSSARQRGKTNSWDASAAALTSSELLWDDSGSVQSGSSIIVRDAHDYQRGVDQLLTLIKCMQAESRAAASRGRDRKRSVRLVENAEDDRKEAEGQETLSASCLTPSPLHRACSQSSPSSSDTQHGAAESPTLLSVSQPLPLTPSTAGPSSASLVPLFTPSTPSSAASLTPLFLSSSSISKPTSPALSASSATHYPSLTLTLAELQSTPPPTIPLPPPHTLSSSSLINFIFLSPLPRAHTSLDLIIRRMGVVLQGVYAETMGMELIVGEEEAGEREDGREGREDERERSRKRKAKKKKQQQKMRRRTKDDMAGGHKKEADGAEHNSDEVDEDAADTDTQPVKVSAEDETAAIPEEKSSVEKISIAAADEEDEAEVKSRVDAESSEHSSSSGDEDRGRQEEWTEVIREERRREEKRRLRKRMQAAARAKDDFYFSSSSSSLLSSTSPSLSSRPSHSSYHSVNGLPPRSPMRAKDDAFYSDRGTRPSSYSFTSLPLSRGVSIQAGSPSPSTWAKVAYQSGTKSTSSGSVWSNGQSASNFVSSSSSSSGAPSSAPSSPLVLPQTALSQVPAPHLQRSTSSGATVVSDTSPLPTVGMSSISNAALIAGASQSSSCSSNPSLSPLTLAEQKQPSLSISPVDKLGSLSPSPTSLPSAPSISMSQLSPSVAAYVQSFTSLPVNGATGTASSSAASPTYGAKKLSTAELIALHEDKVKAAGTPKAAVDGLSIQLPFSTSSRLPPTAAYKPQSQLADNKAMEAGTGAAINISPVPSPTRLLSTSPPVPRPSPPPILPVSPGDLPPAFQPIAGVPSMHPFAGVFPSGDEMRAAIAQAAAHQQSTAAPTLSPTSGGGGKTPFSFSSFRPEDIPVSAWQRAHQFWQEQTALMERQQQHQAVVQHIRQRQQQQQQHNPALQPPTQPQPQQPHRMSRSSSFTSTLSDTGSHNQPAPPPPAPAPQLRTYIRGPIMSLSSLPPQYRRDSSASSSASSSSGVASPSFSERHRSQQMSVAAMIRAYERARQIESVNVARGWDKQRPAVVVGYGQYSSHHTSSSSSPSSLSPLPDYAQPHSAPLVPPHLAAAHYSPLLFDHPTRSSRSPHRLSHGSYDEQRRGSISSFTSQSSHLTNGEQRSSLVCPPWLSAQTVLLFSLSSSSASSCSYCAEIAEKAKAGAIAPGRPRDLSLQSDPSEMTPQQQTFLLARSNGVGAIMAAQQTAKPAILPNFIVTPAIYKRGHPLAPLPPSQSLQQLRESSTPQSPHRLLSHHHHHQHSEGGLPEPLRLHREIELFTAHVTRLAAIRHPLLSVLLHRMRECVLSLWPGCSVHSYGSFMTGLSLPSSDLDLVLLSVPLEGKQAMLMLATLLKSQHSWVVSLNAIDTARVPVIKVTARVDGQQVVVDITFDQANDAITESPGAPFFAPQFLPSCPVSPPAVHSGVASVDLLCHYVAIFPALRPLCLILKQFLYERGLASTYTGGLNSYCLVLMIVAYLQSRPHPYRYYRNHMQQVHERLQVTMRTNTPLKATPPPAAVELPATPPLQPRPLSVPILPSTTPPPPHPTPPRSGPSSPALTKHDPFSYTAHQYAGLQLADLLEDGAGLGELGGLFAPLQAWEDELGGLLMGVLEWYGEVFDFSCTGIAVAPPPTMPYLPSHLSPQLPHISMRDVLDAKHGLPSPPAQSRAEAADDSVPGCFFRLSAPSSLLVISDPFYPPLTNNIGKSVFGMLRVKAAFEEGLQQLRGQTRTQQHYTALSRMLQGPTGSSGGVAGVL